jgi:GT2 family glycosyltransferase
MASNRVAVCVLAFSRLNDIITTLSSVMQLSTQNVTTYVLQNGMADEDFVRICETFPQVVGVRNARNLGAANGRNKLIDIVLENRYEYLCFLDSDACLTSDSLDRLLQVYSQLDRPGLVSCLVRVTENPDHVHSSGVTFDHHVLRDTHHRDIPEQEVIERDVVITTAALISCDVLRHVPRLDERIFAYWEDVDWCLQMRLAGYHHYVVRDAVAFHSEARSRFHPAIIYYVTRNYLLLVGKLGFPVFSPVVCNIMLVQLKGQFKRILALTPLSVNCLMAFVQAYIHALVGHWGVAPKWTQRPDDQFLEMRLYRLVFQGWIVPTVRVFRKMLLRSIQ